MVARLSQRARMWWMLAAVCLVGCMPPVDGVPPPPCSDALCNREESIGFWTPMQENTHPVFAVQVWRNGHAFPEVYARVDDMPTFGDGSALGTARIPEGTLSVGIVEAGGRGGASCGGPVTPPQAVACFGIDVYEAEDPLVNGDRFRVVIKDEAHRLLVDESWVEDHYIDSVPEACSGRDDRKCRYGYHTLHTQEVALDGG